MLLTVEHLRRVVAALFLCAAVVAAPAAAQALEVVELKVGGTRAEAGQQVEIRAPKTTDFVKRLLRIGDLLPDTTELIVPAGCEIGLKSDAASFTLLPGSRFKVHSVGARGEVYEHLAGLVRVIVVQPLDFFNVHFDRFVALVRGTEFTLRIQAGESAEADVSEGRLRIERPGSVGIGTEPPSGGLALIDALTPGERAQARYTLAGDEATARFDDAAQAEADYRERLQAARGADNDVDRLLAALNDLGVVLVRVGKAEPALPVFDEGRRLARTRNDQPWLARMLDNLGAAELAQRRWARAIEFTQAGLAINLALYPDGLQRRVAGNHNNLGLALRGQGDIEAALRAFETAVDIERRLGPGARRSALAGMVDNLGNTLVRADGNEPLCPVDDPRHAAALARVEHGIGLLEEALALRQAAGESAPGPVATSQNNLGVAQARRCDFAEAERLHRAALSARLALYTDQARPELFESRINLGNALCRRGQCVQGIEQFEQALALARRLPAPGGQRSAALAHRALQQAWRALGDRGRAAEQGRQADAIERALRSVP